MLIYLLLPFLPLVVAIGVALYADIVFRGAR